MKKNKIKLAYLLLSTLLIGCNRQQPSTDLTPSTIEGEKYFFEVENKTLTTKVYDKISLPSFIALNANGEDISSNVTLSIRYEDGSVYVPEYKWGYYTSFVAYEEGNYYAEYILKENDQIVSKQIVKIEVLKNDRLDQDLSIDGLIKESKYSSEFKTGLNNNMSVYYYFAEDGLYLGVDVKDQNLIYRDYVVGRFTQSDGFEIYLNISDKRGDLLNDKCFKIQTSIIGEVIVNKASTGLTMFEPANEIIPEYRLTYNGTRSKAGVEDLTSKDVDVGYSFEIFLNYSQLGIVSIPDEVGIAFSHRNVTSHKISEINDGSANNTIYNDIVLSSELHQIILNNGINYSVDNFDEYALVGLYRRLVIKGNEPGIKALQTQLNDLFKGGN